MSDIDTLQAMLSFKRPSGSNAEAAYIERFLAPLGVKKDQFGNHIVVVGSDDPSIMWSSHTDSVHSKAGRQNVDFDGRWFRLPERTSSSCLGADDAAGNWIMMEMIKSNVPGMYIFHHGEEVGCLGSRAIATKTPEFLANIKAAIAFDRRGDSSVITHQGSRCCSDAFGHSLAEQLPSRFKLDPTGILTDTKMYMRLVPECTNISVGYYNEHGQKEILDAHHLIELRDYMLRIDPRLFVIERDPTLVPAKPKPSQLNLLGSNKRPTSIYDLVYWHPKVIATLLESEGMSFDELREYIDQSEGPSFDYNFAA